MSARTKSTKVNKETKSVVEAAIPAEELEQPFPAIDLPIRPPFPPMEARSADEIPAGENWLYEPKWDGFRCLAFRKGSEVLLQSKSGQPLGRYFPEMVEALRQLQHKQFVLDGEIVIMRGGKLSFRRSVDEDPSSREPDSEAVEGNSGKLSRLRSAAR